jgi:tetratricopeptide (TPR) repeat protein
MTLLNDGNAGGNRLFFQTFPMDPIQQAIAALRAGNLAQAEPLCRQALVHNQRDFDALHLLGVIHAQREQYEEAERLMRSALAIDPKMPPCLHNYGNVLSRLTRYKDAIRFYRQALALAPNMAPIYSDLGNAQVELGLTEDAIASYRKALALNPNYPTALNNLAQAMMDLGQLERAADLLQRALALAPNNPQSMKLQGRLALERGEPESALAHYKNVLALNANQGDAYCGMANALKELGRQQEAVDAYSKSIELDPSKPGYYLNLGDCKKFTPGDRHLALMESMASKELPTPGRMALDFALGKAYADLNEYARSFKHLLAGNAAKRAAIAYDERSAFAVFDRIEQVFSPELINSRAGAGEAIDRPIFVLGMPRSGSTLVEQIIASHSQVEGTSELPYLGRLTKSLNRNRADGLRYPQVLAELEPRHFQRLGEQYLALAQLHRVEGAPRFVDKMPNNFPLVGFIHSILPNARIIDARRHPLDACVGNLRQLYARGQAFSYDQTDIGEYYLQYLRMMDHWDEVLPGKVLHVQYEDTVADLEGQVARILEFLELPWEDNCVRFHESRRAVRTASSEQVRQPIYASGVGFWRHYEAGLEELIEVLAPVLPRFER